MIEGRGRLDRVEPSIVAALALTYFLLTDSSMGRLR